MELEIMNPSWKDFFQEEKGKEYFQKLEKFVSEEYNNKLCYPQESNILRAFELVDLDLLKVVILGQDPYHNGSANGLAFSVDKGEKLPASLRNIAKELENEYSKICIPEYNGDLTCWASQGVLLLNTALTVRAHEPNSHSKIGWEIFTDDAIRYLNRRDQSLVFILWGNNARNKKNLLDNSKHLILESAHPSPLSVKNFYGNNHFKLANEFLILNNKMPVNWSI